jgi:diamine N-acetyltransferase
MLQGEKIKLRALEPDDVDLLYQWENDFELWKVSNTLKPFSKNILKKYIEAEHLDIFQTKQLRLMIDIYSSEKTIGMIDLFDFDPYHKRAGIGIMIHKDYRNNGYATDTLEVIKKYCFKYLNLHQLYCNIAIKNKKSVALFKKAGFDIISIRKDWIFDGETYQDIYFLQKINPAHQTLNQNKH